MTKIPPEPKRCIDINRLKPPLAQAVLVILERLQHDNYRPFVIETFRSRERIAWLVKYKPGVAILQSKHALGEACDIGFKNDKGAAIWDGDYSGWSLLGTLAKRAGLTWGGSWKKRDLVHVEMK